MHAIERTYMRSIAFMLRVCVKWALRSNKLRLVYAFECTGYVRSYAHRSVCEMGSCARTNASELERKPTSMIERTGYGRSHSAR
jgi:hypothetical protein